MEYLKQLKQAFIFGGIIFGISLLNNLAIDFFGAAAAVSCFLILAIHDAGKKYIERTNQSDTVRHAFGMTVYPFLAVICIASLIYVMIGGMDWWFWLAPFFFALILFAVEATALIEAVKKTKN